MARQRAQAVVHLLCVLARMYETDPCAGSTWPTTRASTPGTGSP